MTTQKIVARATSLRGFAHLVDQLRERAGAAIHRGAAALPEKRISDTGINEPDRQGHKSQDR
jgi:hypothetical protein